MNTLFMVQLIASETGQLVLTIFAFIDFPNESRLGIQLQRQLCLHITENCVTNLLKTIAKLDVIAIVIMKNILFWDMTPCSLVEFY
jgi:hypothetical protein